MKKIGKIWMDVCQFIYNLGGDKWCHVCFGIIIAFVVATISHSITGEASISGALLGLLCSAVAGFVKEVADSFAHGVADWRDIVATVAGGAVGLILFII